MHGRTHWNSELDAGFPSETKGYAYIHHLQAGRICSGKRRGSQTTYSSRVWLSVPSQTEAHKEAQETFQKALMDFQVLKDEGEHSHRWLPSWAVSLCAPSQLQRWPSAPQRFDPVFLSQSLYPCFERQFGWDELLRCKLGFPWTLIPRSGMGLTLQDDLPMGQSNVVRIWEGLPKKVLRKLNVDEGSTLAFDTCGNRGLAFTGNVEGELSIWDLERRLRASKFDFTEPLLAVSVNRDHSSAVVGSASGVGLWDARSPAYNFSQSNILPLSSVSALKSRGNGLCITIDDSTLSVYDVRMLHGLPLTSVMLPKMQKSPAASEDGPEILEKFTRCAEDDAEYDDLSWEIGAVDLQNASTWVSRLNTYVQTVVALVW
ncbi:hypothetical protein KP509_34G074400 [Ceratopteris richardii]|nr:hypothetical protein KP509_34G074400 [Ceratopteris richardii]